VFGDSDITRERIAMAIASFERTIVSKNGIFETLDEVIEFFDKGGGKGSLALKPLHPTPEEKKALRIFLEEAPTGVGEPFTYPELP
jgi:hypothetical protein